MKAEDLVFEFLAENDFHPYFVSWIILLLLLSPFWTNIIFWWYAKFWTSRYFIAIQNPRHQIWLLCLPLAKFSYLYIYSIISRNKNNFMSIESAKRNTWKYCNPRNNDASFSLFCTNFSHKYYSIFFMKSSYI